MFFKSNRLPVLSTEIDSMFYALGFKKFSNNIFWTFSCMSPVIKTHTNNTSFNPFKVNRGSTSLFSVWFVFYSFKFSFYYLKEEDVIHYATVPLLTIMRKCHLTKNSKEAKFANLRTKTKISLSERLCWKCH